MDESTTVDGGSSVFFIFEVPHEIVSASAANLSVPFSVRLIDGYLKSWQDNTSLLESLR